MTLPWLLVIILASGKEMPIGMYAEKEYCESAGAHVMRWKKQAVKYECRPTKEEKRND